MLYTVIKLYKLNKIESLLFESSKRTMNNLFSKNFER